MIVEDEPKRVTYALHFAKGARYRPVADEARRTVYDLTPSLGRATLTEMVQTHGAVGGVNGDYFQFATEVSADPIDLMVRRGELISHPGGEGIRQFAWGWGRDGFVVEKPTWHGEVKLPGGPVALASINSYAVEKGLTLSTASAGYAISKKPATFLVLDVGSATLRPTGRVEGRAVQTVEDAERVPVRAGTMVLAGQEGRETLRAVKKGAKVRIESVTTGFDWKRVDNAIGGGPALVEKGVALVRGDTVRNPRTAVGVDAQGGIWYVVIDGRQAMSVGTTFDETATTMLRLGCVDAMNLDGGGSSSIQLFGLTMNRPSGGVERQIANGILWYGPRPGRPRGYAIKAGPIRVGTDARLTLVDPKGKPLPVEKIVWSAMGAAWIEGDGLLHPLELGETTVRALVDGATYEARLMVGAP